MALFGKKKEREPEHCCCCGRELKPTGAGAFLLKMVAAQKTGKDFQNMKQEYLLDPYGKGMGKMMFDSLKESGQDGENGVTEEEIKTLGREYKKIRDGYQLKVKNTAEATRLIVEHQEIFRDYEVVKGRMDDVFLAVTGKTLGGEHR